MIVLYDNLLPLKVIGYKQSAITQQLYDFYTLIDKRERELITPDEFFALENKQDYQYVVAFNKDDQERLQVIYELRGLELNTPSFIHEQHYTSNFDYQSYIGKGTIIFPYVTLQECVIGDFCIIESQCILPHDVIIKDNVHLHLNTIVGGRTTIDENCTLNLRVTVLPNLYICQDVEIGATSTVSKDINKSGMYAGTVARRVGDKRGFYDV